MARIVQRSLGGSNRQIDDVRALIGVNGEVLDREYLEYWIDALDVRAQWLVASS